MGRHLVHLIPLENGHLKNRSIRTELIWHFRGSHFFGLTNFPDLSSFFCIFPVFFINFSSIFCIFPVFFHQLFQSFPHFSSVFFIGFSKCSQTRLICALLIHHFCLIHQGSLKTLKVLSLMPMLSYPLNSSPHLVHCKIFTYFSDELSSSNCICFLCSSNFHKFFQYLFYSIFSGFIFKEWPPLTIGSLYYLLSHVRSLQYPTVNHPL